MKNRTLWLTIVGALTFLVSNSDSFKSWDCVNEKCVKSNVNKSSLSVSLDVCKITCLDYAGLWPRPTTHSNFSKTVTEFDPARIKFNRYELPQGAAKLLDGAQEVFLHRVHHKADVDRDEEKHKKLHQLEIFLEIYDPTVVHFKTFTDESYWLKVKKNLDNKKVEAHIAGNTFFGVRHGLETLSQLIVFDDMHEAFKIIDDAEIQDAPSYTHRGIALDTARSYIGIGILKKLLDSMAMNKLNTFHWHLTDTHSFPYVSAAYPQMSEDGAYSKTEVYTQEDIKNIVQYARVRGIRVIPELDAPAHVGEGWSAIDPDLVTCFKWEPWRDYCVEPPCGQFDPTKTKLYEVLAAIYKEFSDLFPSDLFHMGGDEVNINCWMSTPRIVDWMKNHNYTINNAGFHRLWSLFQHKVYDIVKNARGFPHPKGVLWTSTLTDANHIDSISPSDYVIQIWTQKTDSTIKRLLERNYQVIFSNYDELYLDCGGPSWVGNPSQNWCSPYINWQIVYNHSPRKIAKSFNLNDEGFLNGILGSEAAVWTEQIDGSSVLVRVWPRTAALAERLWADPTDEWQKVKFRLIHHRNRITRYGIQSELMQPEWCHQHDGNCE